MQHHTVLHLDPVDEFAHDCKLKVSGVSRSRGIVYVWGSCWSKICYRPGLADAVRPEHTMSHIGECSRCSQQLNSCPFTALSFQHVPAWSNKARSQLLCSQQVCACLAAGAYATLAVVDSVTLTIFLMCEVPFAKAEQALSIDTWSQAFHDTFVGMATLL